jgi:hypothetical protein
MIITQTDDYIIEIEEEPALTEAGFDLYEGTFYQRYDDGEMYPDWSLTLLCKEGDNPHNYLYFEQDGPEITLHNYLNSTKRNNDGKD